MRCEEASDLLEALLDEQLSPERRAELRCHLQSCLPCSRELRAAKAVRKEAAGLSRELAPERDLWPAIRDRIERESRVFALPRARAERMPAWARLAAAAVALAALSVPLSFWWIAQRPEPATVASAPPAAPAAVELAARARSEDGVLRLRRDLEEALALRGDRLEGATVEAIEEDLTTLNRAVAEVRQALEARPRDLRLEMRLASLYRMETQLLLRLSRA